MQQNPSRALYIISLQNIVIHIRVSTTPHSMGIDGANVNVRVAQFASRTETMYMQKSQALSVPFAWKTKRLSTSLPSRLLLLFTFELFRHYLHAKCLFFIEPIFINYNGYALNISIAIFYLTDYIFHYVLRIVYATSYNQSDGCVQYGFECFKTRRLPHK